MVEKNFMVETVYAIRRNSMLPYESSDDDASDGDYGPPTDQEDEEEFYVQDPINRRRLLNLYLDNLRRINEELILNDLAESS